jgi:hypothetical protein
MGEKLEVVRTKFLTVSSAVLLKTPKMCSIQMATSKVEIQSRFHPVNLSLSMVLLSQVCLRLHDNASMDFCYYHYQLTQARNAVSF